MTSDATKGNSVRAVSSNQPGVHEYLEPIVRKHLNSRFRKPLSAHNERAFAEAEHWWRRVGKKPLILDSFCGTGESTHWLARHYPQCAVLGIDRSATRLARHRGGDADNYLLLRADTDDLWRLIAAAGWPVSRHCLLYPNPWPKAEHLKRRCHGSPLFPTLLQLGGELELRSNWHIYAEEFCAALKIAKIDAKCVEYAPNPPITAFERKYHGASHTLWTVRSQLPKPPPAPL